MRGRGPWRMTVAPYTSSEYTTRCEDTAEVVERSHAFCADHGRSGGHVCFVARHQATGETFDCRRLHDEAAA